METRRTKGGTIRVIGKDFVVEVYDSGHIRISGRVTIERVVEQFETADVYTPPFDRDIPSPRAKPTIRKRGAR